MSIRLSGMISGMDTDSIVQGLTSAYQTKIDNVTKKKTQSEWKTEVWESLNDKIYSFYTGSLSKIKTYGNFKTKKTSVAGGTKSSATITASNSAAEGTYKMTIKQTASAGFLTGKVLDSKYNGTSKALNATSFSDMSSDGTSIGDLTGKSITFTNGSETYTYNFSSSSSVADINNNLATSGFEDVSVEMVDGKITVKNNSNDDVTITSNSDGSDALTQLGFSNSSTTVTSGNSETISTSALTYQTPNVELKTTTKLGEYMSDLFANADTDEDGKKYIEYNLTIGGETKSVKMYEDDTMSTFCTKLKEASDNKLNAAYDATNGRFFISSKESGKANDFTISAVAGDDNSSAALSRLGLTDGATIQKATDCEIILNGATITSSTNAVKVDGLGLTINVTSADPTEELTISVENDVDAVYNMVKDFIKEYNELVEEMSSQYYAEKNEYEPLTEDEQYSMTDKQIEKWEEKAKQGLLRRDDTLNTVMYSMRTILGGQVTATKSDGTQGKFSLASFGIVTGEWNEYGKLHIYGDADDSDYADKTDKLKAAIESDPDSVMNTIAQLGQNLYTKLNSMIMTSSDLSSAKKIYNDKSIKNQITTYDEEIEKLQEKLEAAQERYYDQFSAMEVALSKIQSTASALGFSSTTSS